MIIDFFWISWLSFLCRASQVLLTGQFGMINMWPRHVVPKGAKKEGTGRSGEEPKEEGAGRSGEEPQWSTRNLSSCPGAHMDLPGGLHGPRPQCPHLRRGWSVPPSRLSVGKCVDDGAFWRTECAADPTELTWWNGMAGQGRPGTQSLVSHVKGAEALG